MGEPIKKNNTVPFWVLKCIILTQVFCVFLQIDSWPFSNMAMFTDFKHPQPTAFYIRKKTSETDEIISHSHFKLPLYLYDYAETTDSRPLKKYLLWLLEQNKTIQEQDFTIHINKINFENNQLDKITETPFLQFSANEL